MFGLVTGQVGSGKTTVCLQVLGLARACGVSAGGVLSPARLDPDGTKTGIDVLNVGTGERRQLAHIAVSGSGETIGPYTFDAENLAWANSCLRAAARAQPDVLFVDEIGPLELVRGDGFAPILPLLADANRVPNALVVVRRALVDMLEQRLARRDGRRFWVDPIGRDRLAADIAALWRP